MREAAFKIGIIEQLAQEIHDECYLSYGIREIIELLTQRIFKIIYVYEDANDTTDLRIILTLIPYVAYSHLRNSLFTVIWIKAVSSKFSGNNKRNSASAVVIGLAYGGTHRIPLTLLSGFTFSPPFQSVLTLQVFRSLKTASVPSFNEEGCLFFHGKDYAQHAISPAVFLFQYSIASARLHL